MVYVTRKAHFSAAHRLFNPKFSDAENERIFDKCNNPRGHGHNYIVEVTVAGEPDPETGYVIDLKRLAALMEEHVIGRFDHKHLNYDVPELEGIIPTAENIALKVWDLLEPQITDGHLHSVRIAESDNNYAEYRGAPMKH
ncbi:MAG: 6-carboxytetrahydropterin synthase [Bacteroidota bacterium]|nr:6-carboxytetrahydropterin synthase [Bacteroidota bacterium]MDP4231898.1 6-carboxytetrahydropterin synthase [Bacteroidota bacterium]MDP4241395.1 6-carboxytetrahydropterin synthase [Bacteroidota bacterium]MDP4287318.1 6-carboxytetrahydropterin synthase [Bacteroidota bacterium]